MDTTQKIKFKTIEEYLMSTPVKHRKILEEIRRIVKQVVPEAEELISYNMPAAKFHGILLYYAAHKEHIGFYPGNSKLILELKAELKEYETSKGTIRFSVNKALPKDLVKIIVGKRAKENLEKFTAKKKNNTRLKA
jgi:uncharacterized protein YdhG (YjbR/CyaY superfamily)